MNMSEDQWARAEAVAALDAIAAARKEIVEEGAVLTALIEADSALRLMLQATEGSTS